MMSVLLRRRAAHTAVENETLYDINALGFLRG